MNARLLDCWIAGCRMRSFEIDQSSDLADEQASNLAITSGIASARSGSHRTTCLREGPGSSRRGARLPGGGRMFANARSEGRCRAGQGPNGRRRSAGGSPRTYAYPQSYAASRLSDRQSWQGAYESPLSILTSCSNYLTCVLHRSLHTPPEYRPFPPDRTFALTTQGSSRSGGSR